ncbi:MAG: twin-arginine translocase subunit TatB [Gammaproteobacteria bacterium]|nr:twin-arginine translocase subunit TatB [Gammaproteobacteria bacterium]|tara:strand:+ start:795 stop:1253 length:459 start_codon:yes stop_codon:yes gene_type:complete
MFDIGFPELVLIAIVGLLVIGPERLPEALRTLGLWIGRMRRSFTNVKTEIEREIGMDEVRRQLHNEAVMEEMKRIERDVRDSVNAGAAPTPGRAAPERSSAGTPGGEAAASPSLEPAAGSRPAADAAQPSSGPQASPAKDESTGPDDDRRHG